MSINCLSLSRVNAPRLPSNWFWQMGSVTYRFYCLEASPNDSYLENPLSKKKIGFMLSSRKNTRVDNSMSPRI